MKTEENQNFRIEENAPREDWTPLEKEKRVSPAMLDSESMISPPVARTARAAQQTEPHFSPAQRPGAGRASAGNRTLVWAAGIILLLCAGVTAVLFLSREEQTPVARTTSSDAPASPPEARQNPAEQQGDAETSEDAELAFETDAAANPSAPTENNVQAVVAEKPPAGSAENDAETGAGGPPDGNTQAELNASLDNWINATNQKNVEGQMNYYAPRVDSFYRSRNASIKDVRDEKKRVFADADRIAVEAGRPNIVVSRDGRTATMRFRKKYSIKKGEQNRNGEVIQELKWVRSKKGWRIVSERDVRIVN